MRFPFPNEDYRWQPVSKIALIFWLCFYAAAMFLYIPRFPGTYIPWLDAAHMITHESGHLLFSVVGNETFTIFMGTGFELLVPLLLAATFAWRGHTTGTAFCLWGFFNAFIQVSTYMKDARDKAIPLISPGAASDEITEHDFEYIFNWLGVIKHDQQIGNFVLVLGWLGMFAMVGWLVYMGLREPEVLPE